MKDYSKMSDFEINVSVAAKLGVNAKCEDGCLFTSKKHTGDNVISVTTVTDYCNNPSDMWPLIVENRISIHTSHCDSRCKAFSLKNNGVFRCEDVNPLRAAAIVLLMLNEDK